MNLNKNFEDLYQVLGVKSSEVTYPYCSNCFKKVFYLNHKKKYFRNINIKFNFGCD